jgi:hypothetical protein
MFKTNFKINSLAPPLLLTLVLKSMFLDFSIAQLTMAAVDEHIKYDSRRYQQTKSSFDTKGKSSILYNKFEDFKSAVYYERLR